MSWSAVISEIQTLIEGISTEPPWVRSEDLPLDELPDGTETTRHFELLDGGLVSEGPCYGYPGSPREETRTLVLRIRYVVDDTLPDIEGVMAADEAELTLLLIDPASWSSSTSIRAILAKDRGGSIDRDGRKLTKTITWPVYFTY